MVESRKRIWFDGTKLPVHEVARVNAVLGDAAASDDSDISGHDELHFVALGIEWVHRSTLVLLLRDARLGGLG